MILLAVQILHDLSCKSPGTSNFRSTCLSKCVYHIYIYVYIDIHINRTYIHTHICVYMIEASRGAGFISSTLALLGLDGTAGISTPTSVAASWQRPKVPEMAPGRPRPFEEFGAQKTNVVFSIPYMVLKVYSVYIYTYVSYVYIYRVYGINYVVYGKKLQGAYKKHGFW